MSCYVGPYNRGIVTNGLVLYYDVNEPVCYSSGRTDIQDLSRNGNAGTLVNGVGYSANNGGSLVFDGVNDGIRIPGSSYLSINAMSISSWNYSANFTQNGFMFEKTTNGSVNTQYSLFYNNDSTIYYRTYGLSTTDFAPSLSTLGITNSNWYNVVATFDGTYKRFYINGVLKTTSKALTGTITQNSTGNAYIGAYGNIAGYFFNGNIPITSIYNRALSATEIQQNFNAHKDRFGL